MHSLVTGFRVNLEMTQEIVQPPNTDDVTFTPEKIISHKIVSKNETIFKVKWLGHKETSMEPLENLTTMPLLVHVFVISSEKSFHALFSEVTRPNASFPQAPRRILSQCNSKDEYIPTGSEKIAKIRHEFNQGKKGKFWLVTFFRTGTKFVRKSLMEYYFPVESVGFLKRMKERANRVPKP
jgi:hypothetical protein